MGSRDMAVYKILSVLLVAGSFPAWTSPQFPNSSPSTTPVPILRYVDNQNIDGSYIYGYEAADGTYKLETRYQDGRVKGKYGYVDPDGILREASYGAEAGRGFRPQKINSRAGQIKMINGRRALVKKVRKVKATPAPQKFIAESAQREASLKARQEGLRTLEQQRRRLIQLQRGQTSPRRQQEARSFTSFPQTSQESFRSQPAPTAERDPYVSGIDLSSGSYSYSY